MLIMKASTPIPISPLRSVREPADTDRDGTKHRGTVTGPASCNSHRAALSTHLAKFHSLSSWHPILFHSPRYTRHHHAYLWARAAVPTSFTNRFISDLWVDQGSRAREAKEWSHNYDTDYKMVLCGTIGLSG